MDSINTTLISIKSNMGFYKASAKYLEKKLSAPIPQAAKSELQEETNKTDAAYKKTIQLSVANLRNQSDLTNKFVKDFDECKENSAQGLLIEKFKAKMAPLETSWKKYEEELATLEGKMASLLPANTLKVFIR